MEDFDTATIGKKSAHGILVLISRTLVLNIISFASFLLISTELPARDLGIYTAVIAIQRVISFFTDFGLGASLVQKKEKLEQADLTTSFTIQSSLTFFVFLIVFVLQSVFVSFFKLNQDALRLLLVLVFSIFLSSFKVIPSILLERNIKFQRLVIPQIAESLTFNVILIVLVLTRHGLDSFTWAFLVSSLVGIPFYYYVSPWKLSFGINRQALHHLKFGAQFQLKNILATIKDDLLTVILTKFLSFTEIGYIGFAQRLAFFVFRYVVDSVTKVTFAAYARIQDDTISLRRAIEKSLFFVSAAMFPILFGIIITAPYIINYFPKWHNKWEPALISLVFFCLNALVSSISGILVNVLDSTGKVKTTLKLMVLWTILTWVLTPILIKMYGFNGVSIASFLVTLTICLTVYLVRKIVVFNLIGSIYKSFLSSLVMSAIVYTSAKLFVHDFTSLLLIAVFGGIVYLTGIYLSAKNEIKNGLQVLYVKK
ncbi:MAG: hypothetical protein A2857_05300 [Candidatus Levybacteria bacterium RIFCSPHIGHO2_01_FULL_36_15]|nr:MAG: hypothetical protein A2857_05300 [Candidatus Levybacteria bacterium RIFCSPHIGHO2_01_FULL_36_15]OGH38472.1 MAG: hypothetical protein A2905_01555 [Candidatus Levybacteria bacterium RIFCSPLOWO2_01_FULL_36_10]